MKEEERQLLRAVCSNDFIKAKQMAKYILERCKTQKDELFCKNMLQVLSREGAFIELPSNVSSLMYAEDVSLSFKPNRYFLSEKEKELSEKIIRVNQAAEKLANLGINYVNSTLLYGESGTGKTTFGRYIAYRMELPFMYINMATVLDSYLGNTTKNIQRIFDYVKTQKCVFMLDEIDAIGLRRGTQDVGEMSRVVIGLMQNLEKLPYHVTLLAATNRKDQLDPALVRRFSTVHEVLILEKSELIQMARNFFSDVQFSISDAEIKNLVSRTGTQASLVNFTDF